MRRTLPGALAALVAAAALAASVPAALAHAGYHHEIERLTKEIATSPLDAKLYLARANFERMARHYDDALADLARAQALDPALTRVPFERGMTLSALGRTAEAERELSRFLDAGHPDSLALAERARLRAELGRTAEALADWSASLAIEPDPDEYLARAELQRQLGLLDAAAEGLREGVLRTRATTLRAALVDAEVRRGRLAEALALVDEDVERAPFKARPLLRRAEILDLLDRGAEARVARETALAEADRALAARPTAMNLTTRAAVLAALGRAGDAQRDLHLALEKSPGYADAQLALAALDTPHRERTEP